jgi:hypothetical protein
VDNEPGDAYSGPAWCYKIPAAWGPVKGELRFAGGRLTFTTNGKVGSSMAKHLEKLAGEAGLAERLKVGEETTILDEPVGGLRIRFPVLAFGATMQVRRDGALYRFAFYDPQSGLGGMLRHGAATGKPWKAVL